jgi:AsmA protein
MVWTRKSKLIVALTAVVLLGIFLPPNINGTRFRDRLAPALSGVLGRQVKIGQVKYRLLPRPGFDLYDFQVADDPAFSAEPLLMCGKVTADLRLTSLWHGRLEIANLKLTDDAAPPSLNLVYANGHWNVEPLLLRVGQVPSAPTAKRSAEQRARFPYMQASAGRINLKIGAEKTPFTLANTDFAFWLAAEDVWHLRLQGRPLRTDMNLNDTGGIKLEGDLRRSRELAEMPVRLQLTWEKAQLGQVSSLLVGRDPGWRGNLSGDAQLSGTLGNLHITGTTDLSHFRRDDINRDSMPQLRTSCRGDFVRSTLDLRCETPLETGGLVLTGHWAAATPRDYDLSITANLVPLSMVATLARHTRRSLPNDLTATGDFNAAFGFHAHGGVRNWHGAGMTTPFLLETAVAEKPFPVSAVKFHIGMTETSPALTAKRAKLAAAAGPPPQPDSLNIDTFSIQVGPSTVLEVQGNVDGLGYRFTGRGLVPLERLLALGKAAGFPSDLSNFNASAMVDLSISRAWANYAPPRLHGTAHLRNLAAWLPGIKDRLLLSEAEAQLTDSALVLSHISGQFENSPIAFEGTVTRPWNCQTAPCPLEFDLHAASLSVADASGLVGSAGKTWNLPFLSGSSSELPDFRAHGTLSVDHLTIAQIPLEQFTTHLEVGDHDLRASQVTAKLGGGAVAGEWRAEWTGSPTRYTASGKLTGVNLDRLATPAGTPNLELLAAWVTGKADATYSVRCEGKNEAEMTANATGQLEFTVATGTSRSLQLEAAKPLRFQSLQGSLEFEKQVLKVLPSKFRTDKRIYEVSGTVSLADRRTRLKVSNGGSQWDITGAVDNPQISPQPMTAQTNTVHSR